MKRSVAGVVLVALSAATVYAASVSRPTPAKGRMLDAKHGKQVYDEYCAACHNKLKKVGPYLFQDAAYFIKAGVPAKALGMLMRNPVRHRPPDSRMPVFSPSEISDAALDDLGMYVGSKTPPPKTPQAMGSAQRGGPLYGQHCAGCHGASGEGANGIMPVAMFANQLKQGHAPPNVMLGFVMLASRSGSVRGMPTFAANVLSDRDLADIAAHIWAMPVPAPPGESEEPN